MRMSVPWTKREIEQLVDMTLDGEGPHSIAAKLHRSSKSIRAMQVELELIDSSQLRRRRSSEQLVEIRKHYANMSTAELAQRIGLSVASTYHAAHKMGLHASAEFMSSPAACRLRRGDEVGKAFRYPKGHVPANKGKRSPGFAPGRMATTQFRKGQAPRNNMPLGSTRLIDGYLYRKTSEIPGVPYTCNWTPEHYLIWRKTHGPIPPKHVLIFKDGCRSHIDLDNLELITRAELARRNTIHNLPEDLKEVIRLNASIKRRIRRIEREKQNARSEEPFIRDARSA